MKRIILASVLLLVATLLSAQEMVVKKYMYTGVYPVKTPFQVDAVNVKQQPFSIDKLLQTPVRISPDAKGVTVKETSGDQLLLVNNTSGYASYGLSFYMQPDRFTKATLTVSGASTFDIYVDNKKQKKDAKGNVELSLDARRYQVVISGVLDKNKTDTIKTSIKPIGNAEIIASVESSKSYDIYDVLNGKRIQTASLSPNGQWILVRYSVTLPGGKVEGFSEVISRDKGETLLTTKNNVSWMPQSNVLYYTHTGLTGRELVTVDPKTNSEHLLASHLPEGRFSFGPTEDYLLFSIQEEGEAEPADLRQILTPEDRQPGWRNRSFIHQYDLHSGRMERLTFGYRSTYIQDVSSDGRYLLFSCRVPDLTKRPFSTTDLFRMDMQTGVVDTIFHKEPFVNSFRFSPDHTQLLVSASAESFDGVGQKIAEGQIANMSDTQLYLYDLHTKSVTPLTKDFDPSVAQFLWNPLDKQIYFTATNRDCAHLYRLNPTNKKIEQMPTQEDQVRSFSMSTQAAGLIYYGQSASNSDRLYTYDAKKRQSHCRVDVSAEVLKDIRLGEVKDWSFQAEGGDTIHGRFYLPADFDPQKKYPLIVNYYGGTTPVARVLESRYPHHAYAAQGYVVYVIQPSGAIGFGQEFSARHVNAWGIRTADEIIEGTRKFCDEHSFVDASKIGCIGASYGGFMTMLLQTKTDIFAAAISHAGISDITSYWGEGYWGYSYSALAAAHSYPWNARELYVDQSPLFHADKVNTPILFLHGAVDTNVPIGESIQMFTALKLLGKTTEFVQVEGQDHHILDYDKRIRWTNTIFAWFAKWLKEEPAGWDAMYSPKSL